MKKNIFTEALTFGRQALLKKQKKDKQTKDDFGRQTIQHELQVNLPEVTTGVVGHLLAAKPKKKNVTESYAPLLKAAMPIVKQGAIWGAGAVGATLAARKKRKLMTPEERKKARKELLISGGIGALSGAIGAAV